MPTIKPQSPSAAAKVSRSLSPKGREIGRPKLEREPLKTIPVRAPGSLADYLKLLSLTPLPDQPKPFGSMQRMFEACASRFLAEKPWEMGLAWRESHAVARFQDKEISERTEWRQINMQLPESLAERVERAAERAGRSRSSFCYTALYWWATIVYPYKR